MKKSFSAALIALLLGVSLAACSSTSSTSSSTSTDTSSSSAADSSASSSADSSSSASSAATDSSGASSSIPAYPGSSEVTNVAGMGTPPPGGHAYSTADDPAKVKAWYMSNVKGLTVGSDNGAKGSILLQGDTKTGTAIVIMTNAGKTIIGVVPAAAMK